MSFLVAPVLFPLDSLACMQAGMGAPLPLHRWLGAES